MENIFAGGSNSPIIYPSMFPKKILRANGPYLFDKSGKRFVDLWMGYGALLFGHADEVLNKAINRQLKRGTLYSSESVLEHQLAQKLIKSIPCAKKVKLATTGSEATMYAVRVSRGYTNRERIIDISGNYHGGNDVLMASVGVPKKISSFIDYVEFNDLSSLESKLNDNHAAVILEPVMTNCGCILPKKGYLRSVKRLCKKNGSVLIFDEVVTGFRLSPGGAQQLFGVTPDISTFSKVLGGGLPISAIVGSKKIMDCFEPKGKVFFGGTFHANPLSVSASLSVLPRLKGKDVYRLNCAADNFRRDLNDFIVDKNLPVQTTGIKSMFSIWFEKSEITSAHQAKKINPNKYKNFIQSLISKGICFSPSQFETCFLSTAHTNIMEEISAKIKSTILTNH